MRIEQPEIKNTGCTTLNQKLTIVSNNHLRSKQFKHHNHVIPETKMHGYHEIIKKSHNQEV